MKQGIIIYYFRPHCFTCGWEAPRIYHRGEEDLANEAFDHHECPMPQVLAVDRFKPSPMPAFRIKFTGPGAVIAPPFKS